MHLLIQIIVITVGKGNRQNFILIFDDNFSIFEGAFRRKFSITSDKMGFSKQGKYSHRIIILSMSVINRDTLSIFTIAVIFREHSHSSVVMCFNIHLADTFRSNLTNKSTTNRIIWG